MKTIYQCEWDKHATTILERHWPQVPRWGDISTLTAKEILRHGTPPDMVAWGSPCQDLSVAGKRAGLEGERSGLFHEGIRIINELRKETNNEYPKISIWENVAGALSSNRGADFGVILDEMAKAGALVIEWALLDAQYFGIPQRRRRIFCTAIFHPATATNCPSPLLPVSESLRGDTAKGKPKRKSSASETSESLGASGQWWDGGDIADAITTTSNEQRMPDKQRLQAIVEGFTSSSFAQYQEGVGTLRSNGGDLGGGSETLIAEPMLSFDTQFGSNANVFEDQSPTLKASQAAPSVAYGIQGNVIGRQPQNGPAGKGHTEEGDPMFTLTKTDIHAVATPMAVRRLTPLECERLMGWPDDHTRYKADGTEQADTHRYKQCGNGVASPVAEWIGKQLMKLDEVAQ
jgi:DNA (cytosine-5)-methyltransferase 1